MSRKLIIILVIAIFLGGGGYYLYKQYTPVWQHQANYKAWQTQAITDYEIEVQHGQSIWHLQTNTVIVRDGQVVGSSATCIPAPFEGNSCEVQPFDPDTYTVEGLFATAANYASNKYATITYDETYYYPVTIHYDHPDIFDEDGGWRVARFELFSKPSP